MGAAFLIRRAVVRDVEIIYSLDRAIECAPHWALADYLATLSAVDHAAGVPGTSRCLFVADDTSGVTGFAVGRITVLEADVLAELESVVVAISARRAGIGRALCEAVMEWLGGLGASEIELEVRSRSAGPIALYAGLGFHPVGLRKGYYREPSDDAILMRLTLVSGSARKPAANRDL